MRQLLIFLSVCFSLSALAQSKIKLSLGGSVTPLLAFSYNTTSSNEKMPNSSVTYKEYQDSVSKKETYRVSFAVTAWATYLLNTKWSVQAGLGYIDVGFQRQQTGIKYADPLYPGIGDGKLLELSGSDKSIDYNYRYQYLQVPVLFNYHVGKTADLKWNFYLSGGAALNVLLRHNITAHLNQFSVDGKKTFDLDSTGYDGRALALNLMLGGKAEYRYQKNIVLFAQPVIACYPISVTGKPIAVYPFYFGVNLGVAFAVDQPK